MNQGRLNYLNALFIDYTVYTTHKGHGLFCDFKHATQTG